MVTIRLKIALCVLVLLGLSAGATLGQIPPAGPQPASTPGSIIDTRTEVVEQVERKIARTETRRTGGTIVRLGEDYVLPAGDTVQDAVLIAGSATIDGHVEGDLVVILGTVSLSETAEIEGSVIVISGTATAKPGARINEDLVVVGGGLDAPAGFTPGGEHVVIGPRVLGDRVRGLLPWLTYGLLLGRPIVPSLGWIWPIVGVFFLVYLALNLLFPRPVGACADTLEAKPLSTFLVGLLVMLLTGPVTLVLAASVIGLAVIPFVLCALLIAWLLGKVGVLRWIGGGLVAEESRDNRLHSVRSFVLGFAVVSVAYMVPVLGFVTWSLVGVFGVGAAALTFLGAIRREQPPTVAVPAPTPAVSAAAQPFASDTDAQTLPDLGMGVVAPPAAPVGSPDLTSFPHAAFLDRLAAFALDVLLVWIADEVVGVSRHGDTFLPLLLFYHVGFWTWKGTTVGGLICRLRVVRVDGAPLRFADALVRGLSSIFSLMVLGLGCFWILRDPEQQAWHDRIAGTYVVKVPVNWPLK